MVSIIPSLLSGDDLQAGNALASSGTQLATLAGPAIGGALVIVAGPAPAFGLDALSFAVSAMTLAALAGPAIGGLRPTPPAAPGPAAETETAPTLRAMLRSERVRQIILLVNLAANFGLGGESEVALPALVHGPLHAGASGYGAVLAAFPAARCSGPLPPGSSDGCGGPRSWALSRSWARQPALRSRPMSAPPSRSRRRWWVSGC